MRQVRAPARSGAPFSPTPLGPALVGLLTNLEFADKPDATDRSNRRCNYRASRSRAAAAVERWCEEGVVLVAQLGGLIHGGVQRNLAEAALLDMLGELGHWNLGKRLDIVGNHELRHFSREKLSTLGLRCFDDTGSSYYVEHLNHVWDVVALDAYELAVVGLIETDSRFREADKLLCKHNPNLSNPEPVKNLYAGLSEEQKRFVPCNGGVSPSQLQWLDRALSSAEQAGKKVLILTHIPIYIGAAQPCKLIWNAEEVLRVLHKYRDVVVAVFAGHDPDGGYGVDAAGIHHVTLSAAVTAKIDAECCAVVECYDDGWARFIAHGKACSDHGELLLAKNADNEALGDASVRSPLSMGPPKSTQSAAQWWTATMTAVLDSSLMAWVVRTMSCCCSRRDADNEA